MIPKTIVVHSSRGGTGKTIIATNLSVILANKGLKVAFLDLDFSSPSLVTVFSKSIEHPVSYWLNDYLNGKCRPEQVLIDVSERCNVKGRLLIGLANPNILAIQNMMRKSGAWEVTAVKNLFSMFELFFNKMEIDCCILDTSPGVQYSSVNALISSDLSIVVTTLDSLDLEGTKNIINELYDALSKETVVLFNKTFKIQVQSQQNIDDSINEIGKTLKHQIIGSIPCYCDVLQAERTSILAIQKPDHPFIKKLQEISIKLAAF
jgi:MinD-like ATPase involved in chromosome partitioning or flagellar assembly